MQAGRYSFLAISGLLALGATSEAQQVVGVGNFSHVVSDLGRAMAFYEEVLDLPVNTPATEFSPNPAIMQLGNTPGAQSRIAAYSIPGSELGIELIEYKDIDRGHAQIRFQDPGATVLQLRVRDMDVILDRLENSAGRIWTPSGVPVPFGESLRIIFIQDPDGIFIELIEDSLAPAGDSNVYGASFELIIESTETNAVFYRDGIDAEVNVSADFDASPDLNATVATSGAAFRRSSTTIPGTDVGVAFLEFRDIYRKPLATRVQDPGTALLQLFVDDVPAMTQRLVAAGGKLITTGGGPVDLGGGVLLAIVRDPNNLYLELLLQR
jgi:predicted enzyme related to lactoylglutathione lyase